MPASRRSRSVRCSPARAGAASAPSATAATWPAATGQHRRSGRRHCRPVDRRAGHPADHADLPHRWYRIRQRRADLAGGPHRGDAQVHQPQYRRQQRRHLVDHEPQRRNRHGRRDRPRARALRRRLRRQASTKAGRGGQAGRSSPNGTRTPCRSSPRFPARSNSATSSKGSPWRSSSTKSPVSPAR